LTEPGWGRARPPPSARARPASGWGRARLGSREALLPPSPCSEDELAVAADGRGRDEDLVREEVAEESSGVTRLVDAEAAEHRALLPAPQEEEDHQRHGEQQHRPPADDDGVAEEQQ